MKTQRLLLALIIVNLALFAAQLRQLRVGAQGPAPVLRGQALEIVDAQNNVRASLTVDADAAAARTVRLSLSSSPAGGLAVDASPGGAGLRLADGLETGVDLAARPAGNFVRVTGADGRSQIVRP